MSDNTLAGLARVLGRGPATAAELAAALSLPKGEINSALYSNPDRFQKDGSTPPTWTLIRIETAESLPRTKAEALEKILRAIGSDAKLALGPGSTEPKALLTEVNDRLQLGLSSTLSKVELARQIVARADLVWPADGDSTQTTSGGGDTVTLSGLSAVYRAALSLKGGSAPPAGPTPSADIGVPYVGAAGGVTAPPSLLLQDWDALDRGTRSHASLQNRVAELVRQAGFEPLSPGPADVPFDIAWEPRGRFVVCEVKSATAENVVQQCRLALGQVLEYRARLQARMPATVLAAIAVELEPPQPLVAAAISAGVRMAWAPQLDGLGPLL